MTVTNFSLASTYFGVQEIPVSIEANVLRNDSSSAAGIKLELTFTFGAIRSLIHRTMTAGIYVRELYLRPQNGGPYLPMGNIITLKENGTTYPLTGFTKRIPISESIYYTYNNDNTIGTVPFTISGILFTYEESTFETTFATISPFYPDPPRVTMADTTPFNLRSSATAITLTDVTPPTLNASNTSLNLKYSIGSITDAVIETGISILRFAVDHTYTWTVSSALKETLGSEFPTETSKTLTLTWEVVYNGSVISRTDYEQVITSGSWNPSITLQNKTFQRRWEQKSIKGLSSVSIEARSLMSYGEYPIRYTISFQGKTEVVDVPYDEREDYITIVSPVFTEAGDDMYGSIIVTTSRGYESSPVSIEIGKIYNYAPPTFDGCTAYRSDASGTKKDDGSYMVVMAKGLQPHSFDGDNEIYISYGTKKLGASTYTTDHPGLTSEVAIVSTNAAGVKDIFDVAFSYNVQFTITDSIMEAYPGVFPVSEAVVLVGTGSVIIHVRNDGKGIGIGRRCETVESVESSWLVDCQNWLKVNGSLVTANLVTQASKSQFTIDSLTEEIIIQKSLASYKKGIFLLVGLTQLDESTISGNVNFVVSMTASGSSQSILGIPQSTVFSKENLVAGDNKSKPSNVCLYFLRTTSDASNPTVKMSIANQSIYNLKFQSELFVIRLNDSTSYLT